MPKYKSKKSTIVKKLSSAKIELSSEVASPTNEGAQYRLEFLTDQSFRGKSYSKGETITVSEGIYKGYKDGRSTIAWTKLS